MYRPRRPSAAAATAVALLGFFAALISTRAQEVVLTNTFDKAAKSEVQVTKVFNGPMPRGFEPYVLTFRNHTARTLNLTVSFNYGAGYRDDNMYGSEFRISADANAESVHHLLAPVPPVENYGSGYYYSEGRVTVAVAGVDTVSTGQSFSRNGDWPAIAIGADLAKRSLAELNTAYETSRFGSSGSGTGEFAMGFDAKLLPGDWRGYSGLDAMMITFDEWRSTAAAAQQAILEWVRLGGRLVLYTDSGEKLESLGLPSGSRSQGSIELQSWNGNALSAEPTLNLLSKTEARSKRLGDDYAANWPLQSGFPLKSFNTGLILILVLGFGITVGPLNLFVFAKAGKRHRLFVTTPLISIVASLLIGALILLSDGIGGSGARQLFVDLQPDPAEKKAYLIQEQFSRSGVLLNSRFTIDDAAALSPVTLAQSRWYKAQGGQFQLDRDRYSGDWFQSRSEQAQFVEAVRPTRSRVELKGPVGAGEPPQLFSSVDFTLGNLHYIDAKGQVWKAQKDQVGAGETIELTAVDRDDFIAWWKSKTATFSESLRSQLRLLPKQRNAFFATSDDPRVGFVETLDAIRWKEQQALIFGTVLAAAGSQPAPGADADADKAENSALNAAPKVNANANAKGKPKADGKSKP